MITKNQINRIRLQYIKALRYKDEVSKSVAFIRGHASGYIDALCDIIDILEIGKEIEND